MFRFCFFILFISTLVSCGKKYKIEGTTSMSVLDGKMLFIKVVSGDKLVKIDSAEVIHGNFKMEGRLDSVILASLYMDNNCIMPLVIEDGNIEISIDNARILIKGTPLNDRFNEFIEEKTALDDRAYEVEREESRMIMDGVDINTVQHKIEKKRNELSDKMNNLVKSFIKDNYDNVLGPGVFIMIGNSFPYPYITPLLQEILDEAPESFRNNCLVKEYVAMAEERM